MPNRHTSFLTFNLCLGGGAVLEANRVADCRAKFTLGALYQGVVY